MAANNNLVCNESFFFDDGDQLNRGSFSDGVSGIPLPCLSQECIDSMIEREKVHLPAQDYLSRLRSGELDINMRREALDWILKACSYHNFGGLCLYLAMNYLDRFISVCNLPGGKQWAIHLVAISCLSIAAKVSEVNVPSLLDLQAGESKLLFDGKTVQKMEILVLNYLRWDMKMYTPFDFLDYFLRKMNCNELLECDLVTRSIQIIVSTLKGIEFLEFRASEIAAAVAVYVCVHSSGVKEIDEALCNVVLVEKDRVVKCVELISEIGSVSLLRLPYSPVGVLDAACLSYKSGETSPEGKRRRLE